jgi:hypothetical protein
MGGPLAGDTSWREASLPSRAGIELSSTIGPAVASNLVDTHRTALILPALSSSYIAPWMIVSLLTLFKPDRLPCSLD